MTPMAGLVGTLSLPRRPSHAKLMGMVRRAASRLKIARAHLRAPRRHIVMVAFPDVQVLDVTGPLEVFGRTAR